MNIQKLVSQISAEVTAALLKNLGIDKNALPVLPPDVEATPSPAPVSPLHARAGKSPAHSDKIANEAGYYSAKQLGFKSWRTRDWEKRHGLKAMVIGCRYYYRKDDIAKCVAADERRRAELAAKETGKTPAVNATPYVPPQPVAAAPRAPQRRIVTIPAKTRTAMPVIKSLPEGVQNWATAEQVSELTGANISTIQYWCRKERVVCHLLNGRAWRIDTDSPKTITWIDGYQRRCEMMRETLSATKAA